MPQNPRILPKSRLPDSTLPESPLDVAILAYPGVQLLDVAGPLQVFATANDLSTDADLPPPYRVRVVAERAGPVATSSGLVLAAEAAIADPAPIDTLIVAGGRGVHAQLDDPALLSWLEGRAARCRRTASVCTGAFLLGAAGLLDGRRVATHWTRCDELRARYPKALVEADPIFINDGPLWTSAGVTAGIDLALALVEADLGRALSLAVARHLVVFLKRPGGQAQFSAALALQGGDDRFGRLHAWVAENLRADLTVPALAERTGMSPRSFARHYRAETGRGPAAAIETIRFEAARRLLEETDLPGKRIAERCGFGAEETLRRVFLRRIATTPGEYRRRFAAFA
ncbi:GlxA family transcriptional regulator [Methylobacterium marchantiae]|uniref:GlxA family transcriptional regulator n=1 Tax=Methylobacterium marchantiae TaxID=600331 RepID=A0ABW3WXH0_9HYPH|nr:HTH-type transcriptional regulator CdhR [Methylobacterium marchantiae]